MNRNILWNNQQMSQYAVKFYFSASPLYMFRAAHTPIIRSTILTVSTAVGTIHSRSQIVSVTSSQRSLPRTSPWSWKVRAIPLRPLWAVRPVQILSARTWVTFTFTLTFYICSINPSTVLECIMSWARPNHMEFLHFMFTISVGSVLVQWVFLLEFSN